MLVPSSLVRMQSGSIDTILQSAGIHEYYISKVRKSFSEVPLGQLVFASASVAGFFVCTNQSAQCIGFDSAGVRLRTFALKIEPGNVSAKQWEVARRRLTDAEPIPRAKEIKTEILKELPQPARFSLLDDIKADARGHLWARTFIGYGSDLATWLIVDPGGKTIAKALLPRNVEPLEIGEDYLLALSRDEDGVESVILYPLRMPFH